MASIGHIREDGLIVPVDIEESKNLYRNGASNIVELKYTKKETKTKRSKEQNAYYRVFIKKVCALISDSEITYTPERLNYDICFEFAVLHEKFREYTIAKDFHGNTIEVFTPRKTSYLEMDHEEFTMFVKFAQQYISETYNLNSKLI